MEKFVVLAVAAGVALVPPVRRRIVPVAKAVSGAGVSLATAAYSGVVGVGTAVVKGRQAEPAAAAA